MVNSTKYAVTAIAAAIVGGALTAAAFGRPQSVSSVPVASNGKPNLNGIWQAVNTANWDLEDHPAEAGYKQLGVFGAIPPGQGVVEGGTIPYQTASLAKKKENFASRYTADPEAKCYLPGVPRATYLPYPFQIVQGSDKILIVYGFAEASRTIHMNEAHPEAPPIDSWMGRSHGRWDGETLVVDVEGFNGEAWLDRSGNFASDSLRVNERYTLGDRNTLMYEATIEDPKTFTHSWKIRMPLYRRAEKNVQILEFKCVEFAEDLLYGHLRSQSKH